MINLSKLLVFLFSTANEFPLIATKDLIAKWNELDEQERGTSCAVELSLIMLDTSILLVY